MRSLLRLLGSPSPSTQSHFLPCHPSLRPLPSKLPALPSTLQSWLPQNPTCNTISYIIYGMSECRDSKQLSGAVTTSHHHSQPLLHILLCFLVSWSTDPFRSLTGFLPTAMLVGMKRQPFGRTKSARCHSSPLSLQARLERKVSSPAGPWGRPKTDPRCIDSFQGAPVGARDPDLRDLVIPGRPCLLVPRTEGISISWNSTDVFMPPEALSLSTS